MEVLDEKANGGPLHVMEVDEIVSVHDREQLSLLIRTALLDKPSGR